MNNLGMDHQNRPRIGRLRSPVPDAGDHRRRALGLWPPPRPAGPSIRRLLLVMALLAGAASAVADPAVASAKTFGALVPSTFVENFVTEDFPPSSVRSTVAPCPPGTAAVSVGGLAGVGAGGSAGLVSLTLGPDRTTGVATARSDQGGTPFVVAQVTCAPTAQFAGTTTATRGQSAHSPTGEWSQTVTCPAGMRAFGGGGYFRTRGGAVSTDDFLLNANSLTPDGRSWTVGAQDRTFTDTLIVTTRCAPQSSSTRLVEEIYPMVPIPGAGAGQANGYAHCPTGLLPISGGARVTHDGSPSAAQPVILVSTSVPSGTIGWFASGFSRGTNAQLHVVALCGRLGVSSGPATVRQSWSPRDPSRHQIGVR